MIGTYNIYVFRQAGTFLISDSSKCLRCPIWRLQTYQKGSQEAPLEIEVYEAMLQSWRAWIELDWI